MRRLTPRWEIAIMFAATVLAFAPAASAEVWTETVLYRFAGGSDGSAPDGAVVQDDAGNLFGTTPVGGAACQKKRGCETVFKLAPDGTETILYAFTGGEAGAYPRARLAEDQQGNLYGTTTLHGGIFKLTQQGVFTALHTFTDADGFDPQQSGLIFDRAGNLYGTAAFGGDGDCGSVFQITAEGVFSVLYTFHGGSDGCHPEGTLVADSNGNLYGTTGLGGGCDLYGCGTVFELTPDGHETVLYAFQGGLDGDSPIGGMIFDASGNLYGTTARGGDPECSVHDLGPGCGTVFKLAPDGTETILARFNSPSDPIYPHGDLIMDKKGNLYGTGPVGAAADCGGVFKLAPGRKTVKTIYSFACGPDGGWPDAGLLRERDGTLLGTTLNGGKGGHGTVYALQRP